MDTKALKISLAQKILNITDNKLLEKLKNIIEKENIIGFDGEGKPITESQYIKEMDELLQNIKTGNEKLYSTAEIIKKITDEFNLD